MWRNDSVMEKYIHLEIETTEVGTRLIISVK